MDKYIKIKTLFEKNVDADRAESMAHYMRDQFFFLRSVFTETKDII